MFRIFVLLILPIAFVACAPLSASESPTDETVMSVGESQERAGVTVTIEALAFMPHDADKLAAIDSGYAHLFDDFPAVARLDVSATNESGESTDLYAATFGSVVIDGEQIGLSEYQWFADGGTLDTIHDGVSKSAGLWLPLTDSQWSALQSGTSIRIIITDGIEPLYTFDISS